MATGGTQQASQSGSEAFGTLIDPHTKRPGRVGRKPSAARHQAPPRPRSRPPSTNLTRRSSRTGGGDRHDRRNETIPLSWRTFTSCGVDPENRPCRLRARRFGADAARAPSRPERRPRASQRQGLARWNHVVVATALEGYGDGGSTTFGSGSTGQVVVAGTPCGCTAGASAMVLGVGRLESIERGRGDGMRNLVAARVTVVPKGRRDGALAPVVILQVAVHRVAV
jgi:hypothetical protein